MIKARKGRALVLGIDANNVERLKKDYPIWVNKAEIDNGEPIETIIIMYGETLQHIVETMQHDGLLPPDFVMPDPPPRTRQ